MNNYREMFLKSKSRNLGKNTIEGYNSDIKVFLTPIMEQNKCSENEAILRVTPIYVEDYIHQCITEGLYSKATLNRQLASLTSFYNYLKNTLYVVDKINPFINVERFCDVESEVTDSLTLEETKALIEETYKNKKDRMFEFSSARTRLIVGLMSTTGMRINEVLSLKNEYIEEVVNGYMINIPKEIAKNGVARRVPITGIVKKYYHDYLKEKKRLFKSDFLIVSNKGNRFNDQNSRDNIGKYIQRLGINKKIGNHSFRHTFRTVATNNNVNESIICLIGGWSRKSLGNQSNVYLHDTKELDEIKLKVCNIL